MIDEIKFRENFKYYDKDIVIQILDIFLNEYAGNLEVIQKSILESDFLTLNQKAHSLKGVVVYLSEELADLCQQLETKGKENNGNGLEPVFDNLKSGILQLVDDLAGIRIEYVN